MQSINFNYFTSNLIDSLDKKTLITSKKASSFLGRVVEYFQAPRELEINIKKIFQSKSGIEGSNIFSKVWAHALKEAGIAWKKDPSVSVETLQKIDAAIKKVLVYQGSGIDTSTAKTADAVVHSMMQYILGSGKASSMWVTEKNIKAVLFSKDPSLQKAMAEELRASLKECAKNPPQIDSAKEALYEAFVGHIIALIPYCYPHLGDTFVIPVKQEGEWRSFEYRLDRIINLMSEKRSSPIPLFGLVSDEANPILTCMGTTYPAADGFVATVMADFTPGFSVGHKPYMEGQDRVNEWMHGKSRVQVYGMSLGGAFTLHVLREHKDKLQSVNAFNPAGLYPELWASTYDEGPKVNIYTQNGDLVSYMGSFPEGKNVNMFQFIRGKEGSAENPLSAHARVYAGADFVTMCKLNEKAENVAPLRKWITFLHRTLSIFVYFSMSCTHYAYKVASVVLRFLGFSSPSRILRDKALSVTTLEELESLDEEMQKRFDSSLKQKFSWSVLGEFYYLCKQRKALNEYEDKDPDWGRHHFMESSLELRRASVARVLSTLH